MANGTFDPFNVIPNVEEAKEIAVLMMTNILGGDTKMESAMTAMLDYGVKHGARCVGRALLVAAQAVAKTIKAGNTAESIGLPSNTLEVFSTNQHEPEGETRDYVLSSAPIMTPSR